MMVMSNLSTWKVVRATTSDDIIQSLDLIASDSPVT